MARIDEATPRLGQVLDLEAEMPRSGGIGRAVKEVQLDAVANGKPHKVHVTQSRRDWQLAQPEHLTVEGAQFGLPPSGEWRGNVLQAADSHAHGRG
jgi:hypothetical protein